MIGFVSAVSYARFINPLQQTIVITSDKFDTISLDYQGVSDYQEVTGNQSILVSNVMSSGSSLNNNADLLINTEGDTYFSLVAYIDSDTHVFTFIKFNESFAASVDFSDNTKAFVRLLDTASGIRYISLSDPNSGTLFEYIGQWELTSYVQIDASTTTLTVGSTNAKSAITVGFVAGEAYTVIIFNDGSNYSYREVYDRDVQDTPASEGNTESTNVVGGSVNVQDNGSSSNAVAFVVLAVAALLAL